MKWHILFVPACLLLLVSCGGGGVKFKGELNNKFLHGTWIIAETDFGLDHNASDYFSLHLMRFKKDGTLYYDTSDSIPYTGTFDAQGKAMKINLSGMPPMFYSLESGTDSSLALVIEKHPAFARENGKILLKRLNDKQYKLDAGSWKNHPAAPMTDEAIKQKLTGMLHYYEQLFWALDNRNVALISLKKIPFPFYYTSNDLGMKKFTERHKHWDYYFGDSTHSLKAYTLLQRSVYNIGISQEVRHFRRYAPMFAIIAKNVAKQ